MLLGFGAWNRMAIKTKLFTPETVCDLLPQLCRNVICEIYLRAADVAVVACLGVTPLHDTYKVTILILH